MRRGIVVLSTLVAMVVVAGVLPGLAAAGPSTIPLPPFGQCPSVGASPSCQILIVINQDRSVSVWQDTSVGPYDGGDDTLVGVENLSSSPVDAITVSGQGTGLGGLDGDGLCTFGMANCPFGTTGYEGPNTSIVTDPALPDEAEIDFTGGLQTNTSTYFSLEGALNSAQLTARQGHLQGIQIVTSVSDFPLTSDPTTSAFVKLTVTVKDSAGIPIPNATITATSPTTGLPITFTTNANGQRFLVEPVQSRDLTIGLTASANGASTSASVTLYHVANNATSCTFDGGPNRLNALSGLLQFLLPGSGSALTDAIANWIGAIDTATSLKPSQVQTHVAAQTVTGSGLTPLYVLYMTLLNRSTGSVLSSSSFYSRNIGITDAVTGAGSSPLQAFSRALNCGGPIV